MAWWAHALESTVLGGSPLHWLLLVQYELALFAGFWFVVGMADEIAVDAIWLWLLARGRARSPRMVQDVAGRALSGIAAVFIPAWREQQVIGTTISHALAAWPQAELRLYVGCYCNDPDTILAAMAAAAGDPRVRVVIHEKSGPTTKADCLNRLYGALSEDELRTGAVTRFVLLHDAEDMVHPAALVVLDAAIDGAGFVQLPVRPEPVARSPWVAGHYLDEFTESHAKAMVVRDALGAALPAAGVGCAISRDVLAELAEARKAELERGMGMMPHRRAGPFAAECLTEDYELGWRIARSGRQARFLRLRDETGELIATRSCFPASMETAVRQKTRWIHGIAFQSWDRLGWWGTAADFWMAMRDRRGPLVALVLFVAYVLVVLGAITGLAGALGWMPSAPVPDRVRLLMQICLAGLVWRMVFRFIFTTREYGLTEGLRSIVRTPVANVIAIIAGRRALAAYWRTLTGGAVLWDKTVHSDHPARTALPVIPVLPAITAEARA